MNMKGQKGQRPDNLEPRAKSQRAGWTGEVTQTIPGPLAPGPLALARSPGPLAPRSLALGSLALGSVFVSACGGNQSMLDVAGRQAELVSQLWWVLFTICGLAYLAVVAVLVPALLRRRRGAPNDGRLNAAVVGATVVTVLLLFVLTGSSYSIGRALSELPTEDALSVQITGHQWWWEVIYRSDKPAEIFTTPTSCMSRSDARWCSSSPLPMSSTASGRPI